MTRKVNEGDLVTLEAVVERELKAADIVLAR
jgi:hypothetical protein